MPQPLQVVAHDHLIIWCIALSSPQQFGNSVSIIVDAAAISLSVSYSILASLMSKPPQTPLLGAVKQFSFGIWISSATF